MISFADVSSMKKTVGRPNACTTARPQGKMIFVTTNGDVDPSEGYQYRAVARIDAVTFTPLVKIQWAATDNNNAAAPKSEPASTRSR